MRYTAALSVLLLVFALAACGGDSDSTSTESQTTTHAVGKAAAQGGGLSSGQDGSNEPAKQQPVHVAPLTVSGGGSAQFHVRGGDNSVQDYGEEADEAELGEAARIVHSFYVARTAGEWARACSLLAQSTIEGFAELAEANPQLKGEGCTGTIDALTKPVPASLQRQITMVDAHALRNEGEQGFLIYTGAPPGTVYAMPLLLEGGEWKVAALSAAALPGAS